MENVTLVKWLAAAIGSAITFLFGGWPDALAYLVLAVVLDFATGTLASGKQGTLKSKISYIGVTRKVFIFVMVAVGHMCDVVLGDTTKMIADFVDFGGHQFIKEGHVVRDTIIYFYLFNEWLSITENAGRAGLPIPSFIRKMVEVLKPAEEERSEDK